MSDLARYAIITTVGDFYNGEVNILKDENYEGFGSTNEQVTRQESTSSYYQGDYGYMEETATPPNKASYITGLLGALLGAVVGAIPWMIAQESGWFIGWLAFLIGFASLKGYELFRGAKKKGYITAIVWSVSILLILVINYLMLLWKISNAGFVIDFDLIKSVFQYSLQIGEFLKEVGISLLIGVAGLFGIGRQISKYVSKP